MITQDTIDYAREMIPIAIANSTYIGPVDHWVISPTPDYFDGGSGEPSFEICCASADGREGEYIVIGSEWECYQIYVELFGDAFVQRSPLYRYIY